MRERKPNLEGIADVMKDINKKCGDDTAILLGKDALRPVEYVSTGIKEFDLMTRGIPRGKMVMIAGVEGSGKTSFCMHALQRFDLTFWVDAENSFTTERAEMFGGDPKKIILMRPDYGEQAIDAIFKMAKEGVPLIIVDSIPALTPKREFENDTSEKQSGVAQFAGVFARRAFGLANICEKSGTSVIYINQVRDKMNAMPFTDPYTYPGGHSLKHAVWWIARVTRKETLKVAEEAVGMLCSFTTGQKVRSASPFQQADVALIFDKGFVPLSDMKDEMKLARKRSLLKQKVQDRSDVQNKEESEVDIN